jgi:hypothetical protein
MYWEMEVDGCCWWGGGEKKKKKNRQKKNGDWSFVASCARGGHR